MKKFMLVLLALVMTASLAIAENDSKPMPAEAAAFEGEWQCDRATAELIWEEEGFKVLIAREYTEWEYSCFYHEEDNTVISMPFGTRKEFAYNGDGEITSITEVYDDGEAVFSLDAEGYLLWQDEKENAGEGMRFEKLPEKPQVLTFDTIGEAMEAEGYTGIAGSDDSYSVVIVELDGTYLRAVAAMDDEARRLLDATTVYVDADTLKAASDAYNAYVKTLPVTYEEEITAQPLTQDDLDMLAGKTLLEVEEAGYEHIASDMAEDGAVIYTVSFGLFDYNLTLNVSYDAYMECDMNGYIGDLTVREASVSGLSRNAAELRYQADGTYDKENDPWAEYTEFMDMIGSALSGENPEEAVQALTEAMPERAEEIRALVEIISAMSEQADE